MDNKVKQPVKITHVTKFARPHKGGIESFVEMFNTCVNTDDVDIQVLCCSNDCKSSRDNGVFYNRAKYFFEYAANTFSLDFIWKLHKVNTDILIYHMPFVFAVIAHFLARPKYKKMMICYHSDIIGYDKVMGPFWKIYDKFLKVADVIHIQSPQMLEASMVRNYKEKAVVIPYLINAECKFEEKKVDEIRQSYGNKKILFAIGRHVKYKGFKYLLEAMKSVDDAVLLLGGAGPLSDEFKEFIRDNNLQDNVKLLGKVKDEDLENYYEACDIFVLPSILQSETFAVVQLEAMKHSKPVINTNLGTGVNYVSIDNETGFTVEPKNSEELANAINKLLKDDNLRKEFGNNAYKRVKTIFDIEQNKMKYRELSEV